VKLLISNSFTTVIDASSEVKSLITELTTYHNDHDAEIAQLFYQVKLAKRLNNKKMYHASLGRIKFLEGNKTVCLFKENRFPTGLLNVIMAGLEDFKVAYESVDRRERPEPNVILRWESKPFKPRPYQKEIVDLAVVAGRGVIEASIGSGKTQIMAHIIKEISVTSLIIVPSRGLCAQTAEEFSRWFGKGKVEILEAAKVRKMKSVKPISIITLQSLASLQKTGELSKFLYNIDAVFCDEFHHFGSESGTSMLESMDGIYYRFGLTGTFMRNDSRIMELWSVLSNVIYCYPPHQAIAEGYLTPLTVKVHSMTGTPIKKYQKEYDRHYCGNPELLSKVQEIIESTSPDEQVLVLFAKKDKGGLLIHEYLEMMGIPNRYLSGDDKKEVINQAINDFNDKKFKVLCGSSVFGEGVDLKSTNHLILCYGGKSTIQTVQQTGRAVRLYPGKTMAYVHDFRFEGSRYMEKHLEVRLETFVDTFAAKIESI
jgi:superfamily II DNA or RNA helicase